MLSQIEVTNPLLVSSTLAPQAHPTTAHPMQNHWQFWYFQRKSNNAEKKPYRDQIIPIGQIPSIEHFFNYYVFLKKPSDMPRDIDIFFFRNDEVPMWEDSPNGGVWIIKIQPDDNLDKMWESMLFALIGEQFEEPTVLGTGLSLRQKECLMQVWLKDGRD
jgi:translation initiation factor 4E